MGTVCMVRPRRRPEVSKAIETPHLGVSLLAASLLGVCILFTQHVLALCPVRFMGLRAGRFGRFIGNDQPRVVVV